MPELPEVQTIVGQLNDDVSGLFIGDITFKEGKLLKPNPDQFISRVKDQQIYSVDRLSKLIVLELSNDAVILVHLKLTGGLRIHRLEDERSKYTQVVMQLCSEDNLKEPIKELRYTTSRKFGYLQVISSEEFEKMKEDKYGPDPLANLDKDVFISILKKRSKRIKDVLMDQSIISGIGNIYANDALWMAKVDPRRPANDLTQEEMADLYKCLVSVLEEGLKLGGASDQWYKDAYGNKGGYQENFKVYSKKGETCSRCGGTIQYEKVGGRGTFYCPDCQR